MPRKSRLPQRLPAGARYVVEGRSVARGEFRVTARYVVYPDGRRIEVPGRKVLAISCCGKAAQRSRPSRRPEPALHLGA